MQTTDMAENRSRPAGTGMLSGNKKTLNRSVTLIDAQKPAFFHLHGEMAQAPIIIGERDGGESSHDTSFPPSAVLCDS